MKNKNLVQGDNNLLYKMILNNALALCFTSFLDATNLFVDNLVAARTLGDNALVALGLSSPTLYLICIFTSVLAFGAQSVCSYHVSNGDKKATNAVFNDLILLSSIGALILFVALLFFLDPICVLFGATKDEPEVYYMLYDYLKGLIWIAPGYVGFLALSPCVILDGNRKCVWLASTVQLLTSVIGDFLSVYVFNAGLYGLGMATGIGYALGTLILVSNFIKDSIFHFDIRLIDFSYVKDILWAGSPRFYKFLCGFLLEIFINYVVLFFGGSIAIAVFSIVDSVSAYLYMVGYGLSESTVYATQLLYAEKARKELHKMVSIVVMMSLFVTSIIMIVVIIISNPLARYFAKDGGEIFIHTVYGLVFLAISVPIYTINGILLGYLQGSRKVLHAKIFTIVQKFVGYLGMAALLGYLFGAIGLYASTPACEFFTLVVYLIMVWQYKKTDKKEDRLLLIPKTFDEDIKNTYVFEVDSKHDMEKIIDDVTCLLREDGYEDKKGLLDLYLCIKGIVGNVLEHGFTLDNKKHHCNVKVILNTDNTISLGVRDDCKKFDLKMAYESITEENKHLFSDLRIIYGIPKEISYNHLLGFNNTIVKI